MGGTKRFFFYKKIIISEPKHSTTAYIKFLWQSTCRCLCLCAQVYAYVCSSMCECVHLPGYVHVCCAFLHVHIYAWCLYVHVFSCVCMYISVGIFICF